MKQFIAPTALALIAAFPLQAAEKSLWDKLADVTIQHIKDNGPDSDAAQFVSMAGEAHWARRNEFVRLLVPHLKGKDPKKVAGAIEVLHRFRTYHPLSYGGDFAKDNADFFSRLDKSIYGQLDHFHSLKDDKVYRVLARHLGCSPTEEAKRHLLKIAKSSLPAKEQALICLAWHRDPRDMKTLLPFMIEDAPAARSLPYHFRNSYGKAAIPHLKKALARARSRSTRLEAAFELVHLRVPAGFEHLRALALKDPKPEGKGFSPLERITQFATDYLALPKGVSSKEDIAAHLNRKKAELAKSQR